MNIVTPSIKTVPVFEPLRHVEYCGRICTATTDDITAGSKYAFVRSIIKQGHFSVLRHVVMIIEVDIVVWARIKLYAHEFLSMTRNGNRYLISGNIQAWRDNAGSEKGYPFRPNPLIAHIVSGVARDYRDPYAVLFSGLDLPGKAIKYRLIDPSTLTGDDRLIHAHETVEFTCDRAVAQMLTRHVASGVSMESQWHRANVPLEMSVASSVPVRGLLSYALQQAESNYRHARTECGMSKEEARGILPMSVATRLVITKSLYYWRRFLEVRADQKVGKTAPQVVELAEQLRSELHRIYPEVF